MTSVVALLIRLALTLERSLAFRVCSSGAQVFDRERVLSTISNLNEYQ